MKSLFANILLFFVVSALPGFVSTGLFAQDSLQQVSAAANMAQTPPTAPTAPEAPAPPVETVQITTPSQDFVRAIDSLVQTPVFVFMALFYAIVVMFKTFFDYRLKTRLVEHGVSDESLKTYFVPAKPELGIYESLKWGLIAAGLGLGLIVANFLPLGVVSVGVVVLFVAAGFLTYFMLLTKKFNVE